MNQEILDKFAEKKILVIGDYCIDEFLEGDADMVSPEAPILRALIKKININSGCAGVVVRGLRSLGAYTYAVGVIGKDEASRQLLDLFKQDKANVDGMFFQENRVTPKFSRIILGGKHYPKQSAIRFDFENEEPVNENSLNNIINFIIQKKDELDAIIVADYDEVGTGIIKKELLTKLAEIARKNNIFLIGDSRKNFNFFSNFTCITPNRFEAESMYGKKIDSFYEMSRETLERLKLDSILVKKDKDGMELMTKEGHHISIPALAKNIVDVTGVGDNVTCAFALGLSSGLNPLQAAELSSYAAAIAVSKPGVSVVSLEELKNFLMENER